MGLRAQIFLSVFVAGLIPVSVLGWVNLQGLDHALRDQTELETQVAARAAGQQVQVLIAEKTRLMQLLVDEVAQGSSTRAMQTSLARVVGRTPGMIAIVVTDADGRVLAASQESTTDGQNTGSLDYSDRDYFKQLQDGEDTAVTGVMFSKTTGRRSIGIAAARRGANGEFQGTVACSMSVDIIDETVEGLAESVPRLLIDIVDAKRHWIASSRTEPLGDEALPTFFAPPQQTLELRSGKGPNGVAVDAALVGLGGDLGDWFAIASIPVSFRVNELNRGRRNVFYAITLVAIFAGFLASVVSTSVARPIRESVAWIEALEQGDLSERSTSLHPWYASEVVSLLETSRRATTRLRALVSNVQTTARFVSAVSRQLDDTSARLHETSTQNTTRVVEGIRVLETLTVASERIRVAVKTLAQSTTGAAASAGTLEGSASSIVSSMVSLSTAIETVVSAVQRMENEIGGLSSSIVTTNRSVERVNFSLAALSHGVQAVNSITEESAELSRQTARDAESGRDASEETIRAMSNITQSFNRLSNSVSSLATRSEAIDRVIEVIDDVTRATNLLGFNASIIAAQAGEHGAGFAVVAERVKSLADSTRQSTREIGDLVVDVREEIDRAAAELSDSNRLIRDGETLSLKAAESLGVIIESSQGAAAMVSRIQEATQGQDRRLHDLEQSVADLRAVNERLDRSANEQRNALQYIANSVLNARDINERVSATARAQASETTNIANSSQVVDSQMKGIRDEASGQQQATDTLQNAFTGFAQAAETSSQRSEGLDETVRELREHLTRLEDALAYFRL